jgi:cytochrome c peroxidase
MTVEKVALGAKLFNDRRLSFNGTTSCASCHRPELAFTDARQRSIGADGTSHRRNAMSLVNVAYAPRLGWADPNLRSLEAQIRKVFYNTEPVEMGWADYRGEILARIGQDAQLLHEFAAVFPNAGGVVNEVNIIQAIASYLRTLMDTDSPYDRWVYDDDSAALNGAERRGMRLFFSKRLGCSSCHSGFNFNGAVAAAGIAVPPASYANTGLGTDTDRGLAEVTGRKNDWGRFRVPTLRNLTSTEPYMHDGRFDSLSAVVGHYQRVGRHVHGSESANVDPRLENFRLTPLEQRELIEFLRAL